MYIGVEFHKFERVKTQLLPKSLERNKLKDGLKPAIKQHSVDAYMKKREMKHQNKSKQRFLFWTTCTLGVWWQESV